MPQSLLYAHTYRRKQGPARVGRCLQLRWPTIHPRGGQQRRRRKPCPANINGEQMDKKKHTDKRQNKTTSLSSSLAQQTPINHEYVCTWRPISYIDTTPVNTMRPTSASCQRQNNFVDEQNNNRSRYYKGAVVTRVHLEADPCNSCRLKQA